jgi:hypothetical protein
MSRSHHATLYAVVTALSVAVVAFQPRTTITESGARVSHRVIEVPDGKTLLPTVRPASLSAVPVS